MIRIAAIVVGALLVLAGPVEAKKKKRDPIRVACREGARLARGKKIKEAAAHYGKAIARAQKKGDLLGEQRLARSLGESLAKVKPVRFGKQGMGGRVLRDALLALMRELDPKRGGAFVSAHALAAALLHDATRENDTSAAKDAEAVLTKAAGRPKSGRHVQALWAYARALSSLAEEKHEEASLELREALDAMFAGQWLHDALHVATELASLRRALGDDAGAAKALDAVAARIPKDADPQLARVWADLVRRRLENAPAAVLAPYRRVSAWWGKGSKLVPKAGAGRAGASAGVVHESKLGEALPKFSKRKALVSVRRDGYQFDLRHGFDASFKARQAPAPLVLVHEEGGLAVYFWGWAVALCRLDLTGLEGRPSEYWEPTPFQAFYALATGETWSVNKRGEVSIQ